MELYSNIGGNGQYKCLIGRAVAIFLSGCLLEDDDPIFILDKRVVSCHRGSMGNLSE